MRKLIIIYGMYLQMVSNIRKYKGVREHITATNPKTITIDKNFSQWDSLGPAFLDDIHDTKHRHHVSYGSEMVYVNETGRNDLIEMKVSFDQQFVYFYIKTNENITSHTDSSWMQLLINANTDYQSGWHGYDYIVNHEVISERVTTIKSYFGDGFSWTAPEKIHYTYNDTELHLAIPAKSLGIDTSVPFVIDFKWMDNSLRKGDIMDLYIDGDTAPNGRFSYRYISK